MSTSNIHTPRKSTTNRWNAHHTGIAWDSASTTESEPDHDRSGEMAMREPAGAVA